MSSHGAIYQIDNNPIDNHVIIHKILSDGTLSFAGSVSTLGRGSSLNTSDPFYSQNPVIVDNDSLFVVNAGSNSMSVFKINPEDPTQIILQQVVDTNGDYPVSIAVNSLYVAVLNGGTRSGFRIFSRNSSLTPIWDRSISLNPTQSTPPMGPPNTVSQIMFSQDNKNILVIYKGTDDNHPGAMLIYPINNELVSNPHKIVIQPGYLPFALSPIEDIGLLIANASYGVNTLSYNSEILRSIPISGAVCWTAYSSKTGSYYVIGSVSGDVSEIEVDSILQPNLINTHALGKDSAATDAQVATINGVDYLYVNTPGIRSVSILRLNSPGNVSLLPSSKLPPNMASPAVAGLAIKLNSDPVESIVNYLNHHYSYPYLMDYALQLGISDLNSDELVREIAETLYQNGFLKL